MTTMAWIAGVRRDPAGRSSTSLSGMPRRDRTPGPLVGEGPSDRLSYGDVERLGLVASDIEPPRPIPSGSRSRRLGAAREALDPGRDEPCSGASGAPARWVRADSNRGVAGGPSRLRHRQARTRSGTATGGRAWIPRLGSHGLPVRTASESIRARPPAGTSRSPDPAPSLPPPAPTVISRRSMPSTARRAFTACRQEPFPSRTRSGLPPVPLLSSPRRDNLLTSVCPVNPLSQNARAIIARIRGSLQLYSRFRSTLY